jgi:GT2 family glycosyltransferase
MARGADARRWADRPVSGRSAAGYAGQVLPLPTVVIATHDRRDALLATLARIEALDDRPPVIVVDNASADGTAAAVARHHRWVAVARCRRPLGSAARTLGAQAAGTPLVAFSDDDSWWAPGALRRATERFADDPALGLLAARIVVEPGGRADPTCAAMRASPLPRESRLPGPRVLGFLACGAIVRRSAFLGCGGLHPRFGFGGEEELLAVDLATAGWNLAYAEDVVAHHQPTSGPRPQRTARERRNRLWSAWLRRPLRTAVRLTRRELRTREGRAALGAALCGLPWVLRERRVVPAHVEAWLRLLD